MVIHVTYGNWKDIDDSFFFGRFMLEIYRIEDNFTGDKVNKM